MLSGYVLTSGQGGYDISVAIKGGQNTKIRLGYHLGGEQFIKDSTVTDSNGKCRFRDKKPLPRGVYMIVFPDNTYTEFIADSDQYFELSCDIKNPAGTIEFRKSEENARFLEYQKQWKIMQDEAAYLNVKYQNYKPKSKEAEEMRNKILAHEEKMKEYLKDVSSANKGFLLGAITRSLLPVDIKPPEVPVGIANRDSVARLYSYLTYKDHFFDNIDFSEAGLIRSPILAGKLDQFFKQVVIQIPDSINKEADRLLAMSSINQDMFQYVSVWMFNKYATSEIMGQDAVVVHLADKVYLSGKAPWVSKEYLDDLAKRVEKIRPNLIGKKAPDLIMDSFSDRFVSLLDVKAEFTILYFWEPDCGHCKEATPVLKKYYDKNKNNGIEVFAVCTRADRKKWEDYIIKNNLDWINGWDPRRVTGYDTLYNVDSTPIVYILDKNKTIIAKRLPVDKIESFIDSYRLYNSQHPGSKVK